MEIRLKKLSRVLDLNSRKELRLALPFLVGLFALKGLVCYLTWRNGFLEYDTDGFTRSLHAWEWGQRPRFEVDAWLPLQFWLNGTLLKVWPDLFREPRAVNLLASLVTTTNLFFIGRTLFGRWAGYATGLLAALFPWEIWFGLSGMSESLTHMFLSLGIVFFCLWLNSGQLRYLWLTSAGLLGATMLRYEAWFYSLTYAAIVLLVTLFASPGRAARLAQLEAEELQEVGILGKPAPVAFIRSPAVRPIPAREPEKFSNSKQQRTLRNLLAVLPPLAFAFAFTVIWMIASFLQYGSPIYFIKLTSNINASLEEKNASVGLLGRMLFYPQTFFNLLPPLTILAIIGSLLLVWKPLGRVRIYLALIWGEFALFIISTLPTNNIAPGSARYPVSNLMFLLPVVVYLFIFVGERLPGWSLRAGLALVFLGLPVLFVIQTWNRSNDFPDNNMRQVALWFKAASANGSLPKDVVIPTHLPNPLAPKGEDYAAIYGLSVLTNRPDGWRIEGSTAKGLRVISDIEGFEKTVREDKPLAWLHVESAGDSDRIQKLGDRYRDKVNFGPYWIFSRPLDRPLEVTPKEGTLSQEYSFSGADFDPGERVFLWISYDATGAKSIDSTFADDQGRIQLKYKPDAHVPGTFSITARGEKSQRRAVVEVIIDK